MRRRNIRRKKGVPVIRVFGVEIPLDKDLRVEKVWDGGTIMRDVTLGEILKKYFN